jgi:membrane-associated phospholipid phosphatase
MRNHYALSSLRQFHAPLFVVFLLFLVTSCNKTTQEGTPLEPVNKIEATVANDWMDNFLNVERYAPGFRPPVAARSLGFINLAAYEAITPSSTVYKSIAPNFSGLSIPVRESGKTYDDQAVVNEVYYQMMKNFFPHVTDEYKASIETQYKKFDASKIAVDVLTRSKLYGQAVAKAVFDYSLTDVQASKGYLNNQPADYVPPTGAGKWQPSFPDFGKAMLPYWGKTKTFVISESEKLSPAPIAYSNNISSPFFFQAFEVHQTTTPLSYEQQWIGEFWSDDIYQLTFEPAGRWIAIAQQVVRKEKVSLEKAIYTYAKISIGLSDAGVACWKSKFTYNVERPVSYIRREINANWTSKLNNPLKKVNGVTPPFPAYPSGHSSFGGAAAEALTDIYGANYAMTDNCHLGRTEFIGTPRAFKSFSAMAEENAYSRIPLGVHYRMDCSEGLRLGIVAGKAVNRLAWKK